MGSLNELDRVLEYVVASSCSDYKGDTVDGQNPALPIIRKMKIIPIV